MAAVKMSDKAYGEFRTFMLSNNVSGDVIRIYVAGHGCGGPSFNMVLDEQKDDDIVEKIGDISFLVNAMLFAEFKGFTILCGDENNLGGFSVEPTEKPLSSGCGGCSGC